MSYSANTDPRNAPNITMPRRSPLSERPSAAILRALARLDISCSCKASLIVSCAVGRIPGCREYRRDGACGCKPRELPTCILPPSARQEIRIGKSGEIVLRIDDSVAIPRPVGEFSFIAYHGCTLWREGKMCPCPRLHMPRCLVTGCPDRQAGRRCECPRTPTEMCRHVRAKLKKFAKLTIAQAHRKADAWAEQLWTLLPEVYADRPLADQGEKTKIGESAVGIMTIREKMGLALWHPDDDRGEDSRRRLRRQTAALQRFAVLMGQGGAA